MLTKTIKSGELLKGQEFYHLSYKLPFTVISKANHCIVASHPRRRAITRLSCGWDVKVIVTDYNELIKAMLSKAPELAKNGGKIKN